MLTSDRILITGANGMVGRALQKVLREQGFTRLLTPGSAALNNLDRAAVGSYLQRERPDYLFHLAGRIGGIKANITHPVEFLSENLMMLLNVIHAAHQTGVKKVLFSASSCIYPRECPQPMHEDMVLSGPLEPTNEGYAIAKTAGIKLCEYMNRQYGTQYVSLIPCNLYGYNDHFELENSHVISALMFKMHTAKVQGLPSVEVWGSGNSRREFLFVDDFAVAAIHFMKTFQPGQGRSYVNTGTGVDQSVRELAEMIRTTVGYKGELTYNTSKPDGMPRKCMDVGAAKQLGWSARTPLTEGLRKTYEWYLGTL